MIFNLDFIILGGCLAVLTATALAALVVAGRARHYMFVAAVIPAALAALLVLYGTLPALLGSPYPAAIPPQSRYVSHITGDAAIYVTVVEPAAAKPRLYAIPRTEENEKAMRQAKLHASLGVPQAVLPARGPDGREMPGEYMAHRLRPFQASDKADLREDDE